MHHSGTEKRTMHLQDSTDEEQQVPITYLHSNVEDLLWYY